MFDCPHYENPFLVYLVVFVFAMSCHYWPFASLREDPGFDFISRYVTRSSLLANWLQYVNVFFVLGDTKLEAVAQLSSYKCYRKGNTEFPWPAAYAPASCVVSIHCPKGALLIHVHLLFTASSPGSSFSPFFVRNNNLGITRLATPFITGLSIVRMAVISTKLISRLRNLSVLLGFSDYVHSRRKR